MSKAIDLQHVRKSFGRDAILSDVSFDVRAGEIVGLLGPNGAGKSTLMRILLGLTEADSGQALVHGQSYQELSQPARQISALVDPTWLDDRLKAATFLELHARRLGLDAIQERVDSALRDVGMSASRGKRISALSLGMRQRIAIAAAVIGSPAVLILDEPVNGLDANGVLWLRQLLTTFAARGGAVLLSSHLMSEMELVAHRVVILQHGTVIANEELGRIDRSSIVEFETVGDGRRLQAALRDREAQVFQVEDGYRVAGISAEEIFDLAVASGERLLSLSTRQQPLEELYLSLTRERHDAAI